MGLLLTVALARWNGVFRQRLNYIADLSFGIFFIHAYFILVIKVVTVYLVKGTVYAGRGSQLATGNLLMYLVYAGSVLAISVGMI